jgi:hypothetical protein
MGNEGKITKSDVKSFLNTIRRRAIDSVCDRHNKIIEETITEYLTEKGIYTLLEDYAKTFVKAEQIKELIGTRLSSEENNFNNSFWRNTNNSLSNFEGLSEEEHIQEVINQLIKVITNKLNTEQVIALKEAKNTELKEVTAAYYDVDRAIQILPNAKKCLEYLQACGFDTSTIVPKEQPPISIDKDKLFPCLKDKNQ